MKIRLLVVLLFVYSGIKCQIKTDSSQSKDLLLTFLETDSILNRTYLDNYEFEILYTQINRDDENNPEFISYHFRTDSSNYFYPASTVKLPVAALALEKLRSDKELQLWYPMLNDSIMDWQTSMLKDSLGLNGFPTLGDHIRKSLIYSDNNSFNRLYEYLGPNTINSKLNAIGFKDIRIVHRLGIPLTTEQNAITNPVYFLNHFLDTIRRQAPIESTIFSFKEVIKKGRGYIKNVVLVSEPMDFSLKNNFPLKDQQEVLKMLLFPNEYEQTERFNLNQEDYDFLLTQIGTEPRNAGYPDPINKIPDSYSKNFLYDYHTGRTLPNIKIFNKIGIAYGFMIDNSFIIDFESKVEFFLSCVINVNGNQIYNDDIYDYETVGYPFLLRLSEVIYNYELNRKRNHIPDLKRFEAFGKS